MKQLIKINLLLTLFFTINAYAAVPLPVGFERWTPTSYSIVEFDQECGAVQKKYNAPSGSRDSKSSSQIPHAGSYKIPYISDPDFRVMDIEVKYNSFAEEHRLDLIAVKNTGDFKRDSWVLCGLTTAEVKKWADNKQFALLDVERYTRKNGETRWAIVLQVDPFNLSSLFFEELSMENINSTFGQDPDDADWRVLDIDFAGANGINNVYNVILIQNHGDNHMLWNLEEGWSYENLVAGAYQLIDRELIFRTMVNGYHLWKSAMLSVAVNNDYCTLEHLDRDGVWFNHDFKGITIDLEWHHDYQHAGINFYKYYTVNAGYHCD